MTWKEFKEEVEKQGIDDNLEVLSIDYNGYDPPDVIEAPGGAVYIQ